MTDDTPRAQQVRRLASLVRTKQAVMELIKADAERRDPQHRKPLVILLDGALGLWRLATQLFKPWKRVTCVLDILRQSTANRRALSARLLVGSTPASTTKVHKAPNSRSRVRANVPASSFRGRYWFSRCTSRAY